MSEERRGRLEHGFDQILKDPERFEEFGKGILIAMGVEPNLETVLAFLGGIFFLGSSMKYVLKENGSVSDNDAKEYLEVLEILKRRSWEVREAMIKTRMKLGELE